MEIQEIKRDCEFAIKNLLNDVRKSIISKEVIKLDFININPKSITKEILNLNLSELLPITDLPVIYSISNLNNGASQEIYNSFEKAKNEKFNGRAYSKLNLNDTSSNCLYVGTSQGRTFRKRIREHLGFGSASTYSLHMDTWLPLSANIVIEYFTVSLDSPNSYYSALELLEQTLWMQEKPMFGKRSGLL
jgi:hypothetical protein